MVFITMSKEEKERGKAAVDVLGNQIGKTGGSWLMQVGACHCRRLRRLGGGKATETANQC